MTSEDYGVPGGMIQASDGFFYGPVVDRSILHGRSAILRMSLDGQARIVHTFTSDKMSQSERLTEGNDMRLYGVTGTGGPPADEEGGGIAYRLSRP